MAIWSRPSECRYFSAAGVRQPGQLVSVNIRTWQFQRHSNALQFILQITCGLLLLTQSRPGLSEKDVLFKANIVAKMPCSVTRKRIKVCLACLGQVVPLSSSLPWACVCTKLTVWMLTLTRVQIKSNKVKLSQGEGREYERKTERKASHPHTAERRVLGARAGF